MSYLALFLLFFFCGCSSPPAVSVERRAEALVQIHSYYARSIIHGDIDGQYQQDK